MILELYRFENTDYFNKFIFSLFPAFFKLFYDGIKIV